MNIDDVKMKEDAARYRHLMNHGVVTWDLSPIECYGKELWVSAAGFGDLPNIDELAHYLDEEIAKANKIRYFRVLTTYKPNPECLQTVNVGNILPLYDISDDGNYMWLWVSDKHGPVIQIESDQLEELQPSLF